MSEENRWIQLPDRGAQVRIQRFGRQPENHLSPSFVEGELRRLTGCSEGRQVLRELYAQLHSLPPSYRHTEESHLHRVVLPALCSASAWGIVVVKPRRVVAGAAPIISVEAPPLPAWPPVEVRPLAEENPSPAKARPEPTAMPTTTWITLRLVDQNGSPIANRPWRVKDAGGTERSGSFGKSGQSTIEGLSPGVAQVWCPDESSPEGSYTMQKSEHLAAVAARRGFDDENVIWDHPANAELVSHSSSPYVLAPGDEVYLPAREVLPVERPTGAVHAFTVYQRPLAVRLVFEDVARKARPELSLEAAPPPLRVVDTTDGEGGADLAISRVTQALVLRLAASSSAVSIGALDPISTDAGVAARLANLGYLGSSPDDAEPDERHLALEELQADVGLPITGELDDATRSQLLSLHGV